MLVFKIVHRGEWDEAQRVGHYDGSAKDRADGFLHFSAAKQLMGTLRKYYSAETDLVLVAVDEDLLGAALKYEPSRDGALFAHLYAPLPVSAVKWVRGIGRDTKDGFVLPLDLD